MLTLEPFSEDQGRSAVHPRGIPPISFLAPYGFTHPLTRTHVRLLGPCFKTGRMGSPQADARSTQMPRHAVKARAADHDHGSDVSAGSFSSLPRGTCSLSVSRPYLALDGIYRPIGAAFPNNPTRRQRLVVRQGPGTTGLSPSLAPLSRELRPGPSLRTLLQTTIRTPKTSDFQAGLFPVRSPLLRESLTLGHLQLPDRSDRQYQMDHVHHRMSGRSRRPWLGFRPTACGNTRETSFRPASAKEYRGRRFVTPRQTCPRPEGLGRNLRSKTRWFTGFCNSHQVSHFATFFIDARAEISVAESRFRLYIAAQHPRTHRLRGGECQPFVCLFLDTFRRYAKPRIRRARDRLRNRPTESGDRWFAGRSVLDRFSGLLATSRAANHPRRRDPNTSPDHSIGRSDGRLSDYLVREGYKNDPISPCIFIKKFTNKGFVIIAVYVDDLNILGTSGEIAQTVEYLKKEFEMKDLGKTKFCLGLQLEYVNNGILVHQKAYTEKVLKRFNMDQAHPLSSPMVVRSLGLDSDSFGPKKDEEEVLGPEVPYLSAIGALMYLASHTRPDICFAVNLLCLNLVHDQPKGTGKAVFFKAQLLQHQRPSYLKTTQPVIAQLKDSYIKGDRTKHILPKFFFTHDLQRDGEVRVVQVRSSDNSADLFTKALPTSTLRKLTHQIGMRRLKDLQG
ncbi:Reverse transcriptase RNA-dependent DNA polymerase [Arabidopsis suecica]|uniref:Reverse transcriptase RNA-dependent DNA polymerase n=1 Tax=Arabidopsis suecica TaxID=45249 RepID=A0A8T1XFE9_ARASU|nr:Reverse transcriptase RNA-dependent DNA polymerase [Arabidopsis suecica]